MSEYRARPTTCCCLEHIADHQSWLAVHEQADLETVEGVLDEAARFMEEQLVPLNRKGDEEGVVVENIRFFTPMVFLMPINDLLKLVGMASPWMKTMVVEASGVSASRAGMMTAANMAFSLALTQSN